MSNQMNACSSSMGRLQLPTIQQIQLYEMKKSLLSKENQIKDALTKSRDLYYGTSPINAYPVTAARLYVRSHLEAGHCGICYAWLDTAFCPLQQMIGKCPYAHSYPESWSSSKQSKHSRKSKFLHEQGKYFFPQIHEKDFKENVPVGTVNKDVTEDLLDSFVLVKKRRLFPNIIDESSTLNASSKSIPVAT